MLKFILEIKNRFFLLLITWTSIIAVSYFYKEVLLFLITRSHSFCNLVEVSSSAFYFIFTDVTEIFSVYLQLIFFLSFQVVFLHLIYHCFSFFAPATFKFEYHYSVKIFKIGLSLWFFSIILINFFIVPFTWNFFLSFPVSASTYSINLHFEARLSEYLSFYMSLYYTCLFYLQAFVFGFFFLSYNRIDEKHINKFRKLYYYCFVLLSTLLSPPDIFSQILISFFVIYFYEILLLSILFKKFI